MAKDYDVPPQGAVRRQHAAEAVLDKLNRGIVIFDGDRRVHFVNDAAARQIRHSACIEVLDGRLSFRQPDAQARLVNFLRSGRSGDRDPAGTSQASTVMRVAAGPGLAPFRVLVSSLGAASEPSAARNEPRHVLMIYEPHTGRVFPRRILAELYGMSEAETEIALHLFRGETLETAAERLSISINTAKTHLHHIFAKCEVHSQGELLQLLSLGPRTL